MDLGFETIGNATLVCYDKGPLVVTDPWMTGGAWFGSWGLTHQIPEPVMAGIMGSKYVWLSHGHPDHSNAGSLDKLRDKKILLPDHVGGLMRDGLVERGFDVTVLKDRQWYPLSDRVRVLTIADYNQDAILLVDVGGKLVVNLNDADDHGWGYFVRRLIRKYEVSFMLHLSGFGDTDMINFYDESGNFIPTRAARRRPVGRSMAQWARLWGTRYTIPFSSTHTYQRTDSAWANRYRTELEDYPVGWNCKTAELLPAFIRYDCVHDRFAELNPPLANEPIHEPIEFGDDWSEPMRPEDGPKISSYFKAIEHLETFLDFIRVRIGGIEHVVELSKGKYKRGITFEAPRNSFMTCIDYEIFDDMLSSNFMKTTLHGTWGSKPFYPDFTPYVTKYADNGRAKNKEELERYFLEYAQRAPFDWFKHRIEDSVIGAIRWSIEEDGPIYTALARTYHFVKSLPSMRAGMAP